jgi:hypothetical protein
LETWGKEVRDDADFCGGSDGGDCVEPEASA